MTIYNSFQRIVCPYFELASVRAVKALLTRDSFLFFVGRIPTHPSRRLPTRCRRPADTRCHWSARGLWITLALRDWARSRRRRSCSPVVIFVNTVVIFINTVVIFIVPVVIYIIISSHLSTSRHGLLYCPTSIEPRLWSSTRYQRCSLAGRRASTVFIHPCSNFSQHCGKLHHQHVFHYCRYTTIALPNSRPTNTCLRLFGKK